MIGEAAASFNNQRSASTMSDQEPEPQNLSRQKTDWVLQHAPNSEIAHIPIAGSGDSPTIRDQTEEIKNKEATNHVMEPADEAAKPSPFEVLMGPPHQLFDAPEPLTTTVAERQTELHAILPHLYSNLGADPRLPLSTEQDDYGIEQPAVDPAQMTGPNLYHAGMDYFADASNFESNTSAIEVEDPRIQAFAKLEFDDGFFYMNTYSIELGRDIRAARMATNIEIMETGQQSDRKSKSKSSSGGDVHTPARVKRSGSSRMAGSIISEAGGIIGVDFQDQESRKKKKSKKSKQTSSSSSTGPYQYTDYNTLAMASLCNSNGDVRPVDPVSLLPSPDACPLVPIHPPTNVLNGGNGHKGISRKHVKIAFNFDKHIFEIIIKGRNGAFIDDRWHGKGEVLPLKSGSEIQIGGVHVRFLLPPNVMIGETGSDDRDGSSEVEDNSMNYGSEDGRYSSLSTPEPEQTAAGHDGRNDGQEIDSEEDERPAKTREPGSKLPRLKLTTKHKKKKKKTPEPEVEEEPTTYFVPDVGEVKVPKRKGPGRPPKNGIMSKREEALLKKEAKLAAKKAALGEAASPPGPGKATERQTENSADLPEVKTEKRKYTKRKKPGEDQGTEQQEGEGSVTATAVPEGSTPNPPKEKKPSKPPRSPSPVFDVDKLTPEQLEKPQANYVVLIHEALSNAKAQGRPGLALPSIYRAIERKYPYFKVRVQTVGWQSSVRHNLSQHAAFVKLERDGKGWIWGIDPNVSIEKERKRRPSPPLPVPPQNYLGQGPYARPPMQYPLQPNINGPYSGIGQTQPMMGPAGTQATGQGAASNLSGAPGPSSYSLPNPSQPSSSAYTSPYGPPPQNQIQPAQIQLAQQTSQPTQYPPQNYHQPSYSQQGAPYQPIQTASRPNPTPPQNSPPSNPSPKPQPSESSTYNQVSFEDMLRERREATLVTFKEVFLDSMANKVRGKAQLDSAIDRILGKTTESRVPGGEDKTEHEIMIVLRGMFKSLDMQTRQQFNKLQQKRQLPFSRPQFYTEPAQQEYQPSSQGGTSQLLLQSPQTSQSSQLPVAQQLQNTVSVQPQQQENQLSPPLHIQPGLTSAEQFTRLLQAAVKDPPPITVPTTPELLPNVQSSTQPQTSASVKPEPPSAPSPSLTPTPVHESFSFPTANMSTPNGTHPTNQTNEPPNEPVLDTTRKRNLSDAGMSTLEVEQPQTKKVAAA
ncbi:MAG: hypothetical protein M1834_001303 [Cirrosporium novae-zelandiae]|nr:MAG: hypothetical protein M1834_001303 [Cirrosporium novae-zelandiae]